MLRQLQTVSAVALLATASACRRDAAERPSQPSAQARVAADGGRAAAGGSPLKSATEFEVTLTAPETAIPEKKALANLRIVARAGFHVNADYPAHFRIEGSSSGLTFERERFDVRAGAELSPCPGSKTDSCELLARIPFVPSAAGLERLAGVLAFSVCNPDSCLIEKARLEVDVQVR